MTTCLSCGREIHWDPVYKWVDEKMFDCPDLIDGHVPGPSDEHIGAPKGGTFEWSGSELTYFDDPYNATLLNERCVEVPIANEWAARHEMADPDFLEVGNVMQHYGWSGHRVVDLNEVADGVENVDVRTLNEVHTYDRILSVSTLEHVGCEHGPSYDGAETIEMLYKMLAPRGRMLVTIPFGQNPLMDHEILQRFAGNYRRPARHSTMDRWSDGTWHELPGAVWRPGRERGWPSAIWVAEWVKP